VISVYRCIRVKNEKKPLKTRCNKQLGKNGILCNDCYEEYKKSPIPILMCSDVISKFNIPFNNQVVVYISMNDGNKNNEDINKIKFNMLDEMKKSKISNLRDFWNDLNLSKNKWDKLRSENSVKEFKHLVSKIIINKLIEKGK